MTITEIAIKRPSLIIVIFGVLLLGGVVAYRNLGVELMPDFNQPVITIRTMYPGAAPDEVANAVTRPVEDALSALEHVDFISSRSLANASIVIVNFKYGANLDLAMQDAQRRIDNIRQDLPDGLQPPVMTKVSPNDLPIMSVSALSDEPAPRFYQRMQDELLPRLQQLKGVSEITLLGGEQREVQVKVDQAKLLLYRIPLAHVSDAIVRAGREVPAGAVRTESAQLTVKLAGKLTTVEEIENVVVAIPAPGSVVRVKDVATVVDGIADATSVSRYNGEEGIGLLIKKQGDANAVEVSAGIRAELASIEQEEQASATRFIIADDSTDITIEAVNGVLVDLGLAVLLVSLIMLLFLHSLRNSLIILVAIPASLISAFVAMGLFGYTLNLMTLLAMSLIIGILVDDSIVVLENIQRYLDKGEDRKSAAIKGRAEIGFSALSITLVDVVVFLPILFVQVFVADLLKQFSVVVVVSTLMSLFVSFTLTPWLASRLGRKEELEPTNVYNRVLIRFEHGLDALNNWYARKLGWVLAHKLAFLGIVLLLFVGTGAVVKQGIMGKELIATGDQGKFRLGLEYDKSTALHANNARSRKVETLLLAQPEVASVFSNVGGASSGIGSMGVGAEHRTELTVQLVPRAERGNESSDAYMMRIRRVLQDSFPSVDITMAAIGLIPRTAPVEITLSGADPAVVMRTARELKDTLIGIPGANNVRLSIETGSPELQVFLDRDEMARLGLNTSVVGTTLRNAFAGNDDALLYEAGTEHTVRIRLDDFDRREARDVEQLLFINPAGLPVRLAQFARVERHDPPTLVERMDRQNAVTLTADALGRGSGTVADEVVAYINANPLPTGVKMVWGSDIKRQNDSFGALGSALLISFILVYLIMVALYDSFLYPLVVLFSIPVAVIGAFLALNLTLSTLSLFTLLGLIMLLGLVAKNAILIVDRTNQLKEQGKHYRDALIEAGRTRLRPILMTTVAMVFGMLPIALASGTASEWKNGLAWVIIGGLTSSMLLTVFLVPVVYYAVDAVKERVGKWKVARSTRAENQPS
ncbi:MAG: efflux RND transporter permease subunit [Flavobacteriales bacterium]|nr:efflux RND transporter permease subunit [Flavobacteriales bacterium]